MSNYTKKAVTGAATVFIISLLSALLGYLVRFFLARNLSVEDFGLFYSVFAFLGLLGLFKSIGLDKALIKFIPEFIEKKKESEMKSSLIFVVLVQIITNTIVLAGIYLLARYLSENFFHNPMASMVLKLMAIAFFIDSFVMILKFCFQGYQKMVLFAGIDLVRMALLFSVIFIFLKLNYGILSPIIAYIVVPIILLIIFLPVFFMKMFTNFWKLKTKFEKKTINKILRYGFFIMASGIGGVILGYTDSMTITYFRGLEEVGLYNVALPTANLLIYLPVAIMSVLIPLSSELWTNKKKELLKQGIELLYKYSFVVIIPLVITMFAFSDLLISIFFGENYLQAGIALKILSVGMVFALLNTINSSVFAGIGKPEINSFIIYSGAVFNLILNLILVPIIGIKGAAITTTVSFMVMMLAGFYNIKSFIPVSYPLKNWVKSIIAGFVFLLMIEYLKKIIDLNIILEAIIILTLCSIAYLSMLFLFKIVNKEEIKELYNRVMSDK